MSKPQPPFVPIVAVCAGVYLLAAGGGFELPKLSLPIPSLGGDPVDLPPLSAPTGEVRTAVEPLIGMVSDPRGRAELTALYRAMADTIERDTDVIRTTAQARSLNERAGDLYFTKTGRRLDDIQAGLSGKGGTLNTAFVAAVGELPNANFDAQSRSRWVAAFRAIAWAFEQ